MNIDKSIVYCTGERCSNRKRCKLWQPESIQKNMRKAGHTFKKAEYQDCFKKELVE